MPLRSLSLILLLIVISISAISPMIADTPRSPDNRIEISRLFREEMQQAATRLKWRRERLSDDTIYAIALTGASWELAWDKEHLFSLAWGDCRKEQSAGKKQGDSYIRLVHEIRTSFEQRHYREAVDSAVHNFSLAEIGCDVYLKEPVGLSLIALGQPEQALPILSAPFDPLHSDLDISELNRRFREGSFKAADHAGLHREAIAFALSILIEPGMDSPYLRNEELAYLENNGIEVDRVLLGILQAPEKLRGLPEYYYAAADLLVYRSSPRILPFLMQLARSEDTYLRSRALLALGVVGYQADTSDTAGWEKRVILVSLREYGLSSSQRKLISKEIHDGLTSDKYRIRAASVLALSLIDAEDGREKLQKLLKDRAYTLAIPLKQPEITRMRHIEFPVRAALAAALSRYAIKSESLSANLEGRALSDAKRGGQDVSNDQRNLRHAVAGRILVSPLDPLILPLIQPTYR